MPNEDDDFEMVRGSENIFEDIGHPNPEVMALKGWLAAEIIRVLDEEQLTVSKAEQLTGYATSEFNRIRNAQLQQITIDRLVMILSKLERKVEINFTVTATKPNEKANA